jgi:hypothetical protein
MALPQPHGRESCQPPRPLLTALAALALCACLAGDAQRPGSLISQGGFEGTLEGWEKAHGTIELDGAAAHSGSGSVRLSDASVLQSPLIPYAQQFVHVSLWLKTRDVRRGPEAWHQAGGQVAWYDAERTELGHTDLGLTAGTTDWTQHEKICFWEEKEQVAFFRLRLLVWNTEGQAWFDDVVVEETEPPDAFRKVPLLSEVENNPPRIWPLPELQQIDEPIDLGTMQVNFSSDEDFFVRPTDPDAPEITRLDVRVAGTAEPLGLAESGYQAASGWYYRHRSLQESESGYPALEVYTEAFRGSPILSQFMRLYMANGSQVGQFEVSFRVPEGLTHVTYFRGNAPETGELAGTEVILPPGSTTKPFVVLHRPDDSAGLVIYHPVPAETGRWHVEDYVPEAHADIVYRTREEDDDRVLYWDFRNLVAGPGGYDHTFDFYVFLMAYAGKVADALREFQTGDVDLTADEPPLGPRLPEGYWTPWMPNSRGARILRMARYHPQEFASWVSGMYGKCYGHRNGRMWGSMTQQMKGIRVDPLAERALLRDHAFRMLNFFVERANDHGAPPDLMTWRDVAARLPNPEDYYNHVFCQYWEYRVGEFRKLMESPLLLDPEKEEVYLKLQRAKNLFDPNQPGSWTEVLPDGEYWFKYMDLPIWPENQWVINTHATSVGVAGQFCWLAWETDHMEDATWWSEVFKRGVDGLLYAFGQDWMWYGDAHDENELRYAGKRGGPRSYHTYMMTAWLPEVIRSAVTMKNYRVDELVAYERRLMKAKFLEDDSSSLKLAQDFLESTGRGTP